MNTEALKRKLLRLDDLEEGADLEKRMVGLDWPKEAETMIGVKRLENIQYCIEQIIKDNIEGDLIETGVWRGGACIFMRGILKAYNNKRKVYVADSFKGFPVPKFKIDKDTEFLNESILKVSLEEVKRNFEKYDLLDEQVVFLEGYFADTLPKVNGPFSLIRLDGDLFESTWDALVNLYSKLSVGGYVIIDDFGQLEPCQAAVGMFRTRYNISEKIQQIDHAGIYWKKER